MSLIPTQRSLSLLALTSKSCQTASTHPAADSASTPARRKTVNEAERICRKTQTCEKVGKINNSSHMSGSWNSKAGGCCGMRSHKPASEHMVWCQREAGGRKEWGKSNGWEIGEERHGGSIEGHFPGTSLVDRLAVRMWKKVSAALFRPRCAAAVTCCVCFPPTLHGDALRVWEHSDAAPLRMVCI